MNSSVQESNRSNRIAVVGAGAVGSTIAYAAMIQGLAHEIVLIDAVAGKAEAEAKDLMHGSMFVPAVEGQCGRPGPVQGCSHRRHHGRGQTAARTDAVGTVGHQCQDLSGNDPEDSDTALRKRCFW